MMGVAKFVIALMVAMAIMVTCLDGKELLDEQEIKAEKLLKMLNKPALKSIKSEDGDIIDCVPITSQPAFDNPLLKNHTIQMRPSFVREGDSTHTKKKTKHNTQSWQKNGEFCPKNTVPIRRIKKEDILRAKSVESFRKKNYQSIPEDEPSKGHEYAIMNSQNGKYFGTKFVVNLWKPEVQRPDEFSLFQTWLVSQSGDRSTLNTIEAGFQVLPLTHKNVSTLRLFVYWTVNNYQQGMGGSCYNVQNCPGFVQVSNSVMVDGSYDNDVSQYDGDQQERSMQIRKDHENYWLQINGEYVGYWPDSLFTSLQNGATEVQWGGEIVNLQTKERHTTTDMGSGQFAEEGFGRASYFRNIMIYDETNTPMDPVGIYPTITKKQCYNLQEGKSGTTWGVHFYYGGPGQNPNCP